MTWTDDADAEVNRLASIGKPFTSDDLVGGVGHPDPSHAANGKNNAVGSVLSRAARAGLIKVIGHTESKQPHRKQGLIRIWQGTNAVLATTTSTQGKKP